MKVPEKRSFWISLDYLGGPIQEGGREKDQRMEVKVRRSKIEDQGGSYEPRNMGSPRS